MTHTLHHLLGHRHHLRVVHHLVHAAHEVPPVVRTRELTRQRKIAESGKEARGEDSAKSGQEGASGDRHDRAESQRCTRWEVGSYGSTVKDVCVKDAAQVKMAHAILRSECKGWAQAGTVGCP
jgi:hypothetical protein